MLGVLKQSEERGVLIKQESLLGMPVLQVSLSTKGWWATRRLRRAARTLSRRGVHRVLVPPGFDAWRELCRWGLRGVDPLPLYRAVADRLVIAELERRGVDVVRACVALQGDFVDGDLARTAWLLCPRVRTVIVQVERGGERLVRELYREFGAAALPDAEADVKVRFSGEGNPGELVLCGRPELLGLSLELSGIELPEGVESLPLMTALWQAGKLSPEQLSVVPADFS